MGVRSSWLASETKRIWALYALLIRSSMALMAWARERSSFWVAGRSMRLSRWVALIFSSSPARASSSCRDIWVMELSREAVAARSWMGFRILWMDRLFRNSPVIRDSPSHTSRTIPAQ